MDGLFPQALWFDERRLDDDVELVHKASQTTLYLHKNILNNHSPKLLEDETLSLLQNCNLPIEALLDFFTALYFCSIDSPMFVTNKWMCGIKRLLHIAWVNDLLNMSNNRVVLKIINLLLDLLHRPKYEDEATLLQLVDYLKLHRLHQIESSSPLDILLCYTLTRVIPDLTPCLPSKYALALKTQNPNVFLEIARGYWCGDEELVQKKFAFLAKLQPKLYSICLSNMKRRMYVDKRSEEEALCEREWLNNFNNHEKQACQDIFEKSHQWAPRYLLPYCEIYLEALNHKISKSKEIVQSGDEKVLYSEDLLEKDQDFETMRRVVTAFIDTSAHDEINLRDDIDIFGNSCNFLLKSDDGLLEIAVHDWTMSSWKYFDNMQKSGGMEISATRTAELALPSFILLLVVASCYGANMIVDLITSNMTMNQCVIYQQISQQYYLPFDEESCKNSPCFALMFNKIALRPAALMAEKINGSVKK